jgi:hypothetical protein
MVSIVGGAACSPLEADMAERVGRLLAQRGVVVVTGGRGGVMEAACRGAQAAGGLTLGLLPGAGWQEANAFLDLALPTNLGDARNALVARAGEAVIAIGGGPGTLSEIGLALKAGRRVVGLHSWAAQDGAGKAAQILVAQTPEEAVSLALDEAYGGEMIGGPWLT